MKRALLLAPLLVLAAQSAEGQVFTPPPRISQPPRTETTQRVQLNVSAMGGYDQNDVPSNVPQGPELNVRQSSSTGTLDGSLGYALAAGARSLNVRAGGSATSYSNVGGSPGPVYAADASANFRSPLGARTTVDMSHTSSRLPYISMGLFANPRSAPAIAYDADGNPLNGLINGYIWMSASAAGFRQSLTRRTTAGLRYTYQSSRHEGTGNDLDYKSHSATVDLGQQVSRTIDVRTSYRVSVRGANQTGVQYDDLHHSFTGMFRIAQPISRTRTLDISVGGGADLIKGTSSSDPTFSSEPYWRPTYYARIGSDIARTWTAVASYTQTQNLLHSPLSAPDSYTIHSAVLSSGGNLNQRMGLVLHAGVTSGEVPANHSITSTRGEYFGLTGGAQLSIGLISSLSAIVNANYFKSELSGAANVLAQGTGVYQRNSFRVGFQWTVPLYDSARNRRR